jgi:glycosyltransferase involved in cell wall biosynthesis
MTEILFKNKILIIAPSPEKGFDGIRDYVKCTVAYLKDYYDITVATTEYSNSAFEKYNNLAVLNIPNKWNIRSFYIILSWLKIHRPSLVHIHYQAFQYNQSPSIVFLYLIVRFLFRIDIVTTFHDILAPYPISPSLVLFLRQNILKYFRTEQKKAFEASVSKIKSSNITIFKILSNSIIKLLLKLSNRIIITNTIDEAKITDILSSIIPRVRRIPVGSAIGNYSINKREKLVLLRKYSIRDSEKIILYFGFPGGGKGLERLVGAYSDLQTNRKIKNIQLIIAGEIKKNNVFEIEYFNKIIKKIKKLNLEDSIIWTGALKEQEISHLFQLAYIVVQPYDEGVSFRRTSFLCGVIHGSAIITLQGDCPPGELVDNKNIFMVGDSSEVKLADKIEEVLNNNALRCKVAENMKILSSRFTWDIINKDIKKVYDGVIEK